MVKARVKIRERLLDVEATDRVEVCALRQPIGSANDRAHEAEVLGEQLGRVDAAVCKEELLRLENELVLREGHSRVGFGVLRRLVEEHGPSRIARRSSFPRA